MQRLLLICSCGATLPVEIKSSKNKESEMSCFKCSSKWKVIQTR